MLKRLLGDRHGQSVVEYALFIALVLLLVLALFTAVFWKGTGY